MFWLRLSGWLFVLLLIATATVMFVGSRLPADHTTTATAIIHSSPDRIWSLLTDAAAQPHWRSDVSSVDPLPDDHGLPCWLELHGRQPIPVCIAESVPDRHLVLRTADPRLPFRAIRSLALSADPANPVITRVTITETVSITPPMLRFYDRYVLAERTRPNHLLADLDRATTPSTTPDPAVR